MEGLFSTGPIPSSLDLGSSRGVYPGNDVCNVKCDTISFLMIQGDSVVWHCISLTKCSTCLNFIFGPEWNTGKFLRRAATQWRESSPFVEEILIGFAPGFITIFYPIGCPINYSST